MNEPWKDDECAPDCPGLALFCRFLDPSPSFVLGYEAGMLSARMASRETPIVCVAHAENDEQLILLARAHGYRVAFAPMDDEWTHATFTEGT